MAQQGLSGGISHDGSAIRHKSGCGGVLRQPGGWGAGEGQRLTLQSWGALGHKHHSVPRASDAQGHRDTAVHPVGAQAGAEG